jgi:hypothetical protein
MSGDGSAEGGGCPETFGSRVTSAGSAPSIHVFFPQSRPSGVSTVQRVGNPLGGAPKSFRERVTSAGSARLFPTKRKSEDRGAIVKPCGTTAAAQRHYKAGERPCEACAEAMRADARRRYREAPEAKRAAVRVYQARMREASR